MNLEVEYAFYQHLTTNPAYWQPDSFDYYPVINLMPEVARSLKWNETLQYYYE